MREEIGPCLDFRLPYRPIVITGHRPKRKFVPGGHIVLERKLGRPIREGYWALHHCDRERCIRDEHLYEGTPKDNVRDRDLRTGNPIKKVNNKGERHYRSILTVELVREIRQKVGKGIRQCVLAREYGLKPATVFAVVSRTTWQHV